MTSRHVRRRALVLGLCVLAMVAGCTGNAGTTSTAPSPGGSASAGADQVSGPTADRIRDAGVLKVGAAIAMPTLGKDPSTGEYVGAGTVLADELAKRLGVRVEYLDQDWGVIPAAIQSGKIDVSVAGMYVTPVRLEAIGMTPWWEAGFCYLALKTNDKLSSAADLNNPNVTIATFEGSGTYQSVSAAYPNAKYITRPEIPGEYAAITEVKGGQADATPIDNVLVNLFLERNPDLKVIPDDCVKKPDLSGWVGVAYPKGDEAFKTFVEQTVADIRPELDAALDKFLESKWMELGL